MTRFLRIALVAGAPLLGATLLSDAAAAQSFGPALYGPGVVSGSRSWVDDGAARAPRVETVPVYNLDPGFVWNAPSAFSAAPAGRTPLAAAPDVFTGPRNEP